MIFNIRRKIQISSGHTYMNANIHTTTNIANLAEKTPSYITSWNGVRYLTMKNMVLGLKKC